MQHRAYSVIGGAVLGFSLGVICFAGGWARPATAQFQQPLIPQSQPNIIGQNAGTTPPVQPIEIQALEADRFVVATREPRLVAQIGREGAAQNMIVTVVTHYTVKENRLIPLEHVRVPAGYRLITLAE